MVTFSLHYLEVSSLEASRLDTLVYEGYLAGLRDAGWQGDEAVVRLGYTTATAVALDLCCPGYTLPHVEEHEVWEEWEQFFSRPADDIREQWRESHQLGLTLADEALTLLDRVSVS